MKHKNEVCFQINDETRKGVQMRGHIKKCFILCLSLVFVLGGVAAPNVFGSDEEMWRQFAGMELNFLTEDTPAAGAILELLPQFQEKTGIKVNVTRTNIADLVTKLMLELGAGSSNIHVIYSARWQIPPGRSEEAPSERCRTCASSDRC